MGCNQNLFLQFGNKKPKTPLSHDRCQEFLEKAKKNDQNRMLLDFLNSDSAQNLKLICKRCGLKGIEKSARAFFSSNGTDHSVTICENKLNSDAFDQTKHEMIHAVDYCKEVRTLPTVICWLAEIRAAK